MKIIGWIIRAKDSNSRPLPITTAPNLPPYQFIVYTLDVKTLTLYFAAPRDVRFKWAIPGLFLIRLTGNNKSVDDGIRNMELWCRKRPLYQMHRNHGKEFFYQNFVPRNFLPQFITLFNKASPLSVRFWLFKNGFQLILPFCKKSKKNWKNNSSQGT